MNATLDVSLRCIRSNFVGLTYGLLETQWIKETWTLRMVWIFPWRRVIFWVFKPYWRYIFRIFSHQIWQFLYRCFTDFKFGGIPFMVRIASLSTQRFRDSAIQRLIHGLQGLGPKFPVLPGLHQKGDTEMGSCPLSIMWSVGSRSLCWHFWWIVQLTDTVLSIESELLLQWLFQQNRVN